MVFEIKVALQIKIIPDRFFFLQSQNRKLEILQFLL